MKFHNLVYLNPDASLVLEVHTVYSVFYDSFTIQIHIFLLDPLPPSYTIRAYLCFNDDKNHLCEVVSRGPRELYTVPAPINGAASIQKLFFRP